MREKERERDIISERDNTTNSIVLILDGSSEHIAHCCVGNQVCLEKSKFDLLSI